MTTEYTEYQLEKEVVNIFKDNPNVKFIGAIGEDIPYATIAFRLGKKYPCQIVEELTEKDLSSYLRMQIEDDETDYTVMVSNGACNQRVKIEECETLKFIETIYHTLREELNYTICCIIVEMGTEQIEVEFLVDVQSQKCE